MQKIGARKRIGQEFQMGEATYKISRLLLKTNTVICEKVLSSKSPKDFPSQIVLSASQIPFLKSEIPQINGRRLYENEKFVEEFSSEQNGKLKVSNEIRAELYEFGEFLEV